MPNWTENKLSVDNVTPEFIEYLETEGFSFEKMAPPNCPENDENGFATVSAQNEAWGTKWDLPENEQKEVAASLITEGVASFDTAWSPPIQAITALSTKFPEVSFTLAYYEGGMFFWGVCDIQDGCTSDSEGEGNAEEASQFLQDYMGYDKEDADELTGVNQEDTDEY